MMSLTTLDASAQFPDSLDLAVTPADVTILGARALDYMGSSMCSGDINGDGLPDLVVTACSAAPLNGQRVGETYVIWGPSLSSPGTMDLLTETSSVSRIFGMPGDDDLYCQVTCGDFNADGRDDILIGSPGNGYSWDGKAYVVLGRPDFPDTLDLAMGQPGVIRIYGMAGSGSFMSRGVCACDVNGDGYDDMIIGAPGLWNAEVYVIRGGDTLQPIYDMDNAEPGLTRIMDHEVFRGTGMEIACGDFDRDGHDDLVLGAPGIDVDTYDGLVTLLYGEATLPDTIALNDDSFQMKRILPEYRHGQLGWALATGDVNGDGQEDLIAGAVQADPQGCLNCGEVYVLYAADDLPDSTWVSSLGAPMSRIQGYGSSTWHGIDVLCTDFTRDSYEDIVISNDPHDLGNEKGITTVLYARDLLPDSVFLQTETVLISRIRAAEAQDKLGTALAAADFNGDGHRDLVAGAWRGKPLGRQSAGTAYVMFSGTSATGISSAATPPFILEQNYPNPFESSTVIRYVLAHPASAVLTIFNVAGERVREIQNPVRLPGERSMVWDGFDADGRRVASGVYFYQLRAGGHSQTRKLVILR